MSTNYMQNERQLDKVLRTFAQETLKPSDAYQTKAKEIQQRVVLALQRSNSTYRVGRVILSGSFGKTTNIKPFDIDLVAFVNYAEPPFDQVLRDWGKVFTSSGLFDTVEAESRYLIKLTYDNFRIDLLPAANFNLNVGSSSNLDPMKVQFVNALNRINKEANPGNSMFSSSLAEYQVAFIKSQSDFVHQLIRLCKYWKDQIKPELENKTGTKIDGFSLAIELIAVHVGKRELEPGSSMVQAFRSFLTSIANFNNIEARIELPMDVYREIYPKTFPVFNKPVILDPANPWNNLARNFQPDQKKWLKYFAERTLGKLEQLIQNIPSGCNENSVRQKLFD